MTWYGESYALDWGSVISGAPFAFNDLTYHYDTRHHVMAAGESFTIGSYLDTVDPSGFAAFTDPIEIRWVIEVNGGSGSLHLFGGADPSEAYTNTSLATQDLGTYAVTGPTTIVSPPITGVTKAQLQAYSTYPFVWIQCTAGTVDIQQVKMRVWPTAGPSGAWTTTGATAFTGTAGTTRIRAEKNQQSWGHGSESAAWAAAVGIVDAWNGSALGTLDTPWGASTHTPLIETHMSVAFDIGTGLGYASYASSTSSIFTPAGSPASIYDTPVSSSAGYDPREIRYESLSRLRAIGGGPVLPTVTGLSATITGQDHVNVAMEAMTQADVDLAVSAGTYRFASPAGAVAIPEMTATSLPVPGTGPVLVSIYPDIYFTDPGGSGATRNSITLSFGMTASVSYSGYEWFDPTLPWVDTPPPTGPTINVGPGYFLNPHSNLDGSPLDVAVEFFLP